MEYKAPLETYTGRIREVTIGKGGKAIRVGGSNILPLHHFEGNAANRPVVALEVDDNGAAGWAGPAVEPFRDVVNDPEMGRRCLVGPTWSACTWRTDHKGPTGMQRRPLWLKDGARGGFATDCIWLEMIRKTLKY
jgi:hypothetical protein